MKKIILLSVAVIATFCAIAQPNLTNETTSPGPGDKFYSKDCVRTGVSKGAGGANAVWDFSGLQPFNIFSDSTIYVRCDSTPYCDSVTFASVAYKMSNGWGYKYFVASPFKFYEVADVRPGESWNYSRYADILPYPMSYDSVVLDTFLRTQPAFGNMVYGISTFVGDGFGKLIIPSGSYDNVVRVRITTTFTQTTSFPGTPTSATGTTEEYRWYTPGFHSPLLIISYNGSSSGGASGVYYYMPNPFSDAVTTVDSYLGNVEIAPNPVSDVVHLNFDAKNSGSVRISLTDMLGRASGTVKEEYVHAGKTDIGYDVSTLPTGVYLLKIETPSGSIQKKMQVAR